MKQLLQHKIVSLYFDEKKILQCWVGEKVLLFHQKHFGWHYVIFSLTHFFNDRILLLNKTVLMRKKRLPLSSNKVRHLHNTVGTGMKGEPFRSLFPVLLLFCVLFNPLSALYRMFEAPSVHSETHIHRCLSGGISKSKQNAIKRCCVLLLNFTGNKVLEKLVL